MTYNKLTGINVDWICYDRKYAQYNNISSKTSMFMMQAGVVDSISLRV